MTKEEGKQKRVHIEKRNVDTKLKKSQRLSYIYNKSLFHYQYISTWSEIIKNIPEYQISGNANSIIYQLSQRPHDSSPGNAFRTHFELFVCLFTLYPFNVIADFRQ